MSVARSLVRRSHGLLVMGGGLLAASVVLLLTRTSTQLAFSDDTVTVSFSASSAGHFDQSDSQYSGVHNCGWGYWWGGGTYDWVFQWYNTNGTYQINRGMLYFDTSSIPDNATITSATLSLYGYDNGHTGPDWNLVIQNGQPTYPHSPADMFDYDCNHYSGNGGQISVHNPWWSVSGYNNITMNATGLSWINKTGPTKLCMRTSRDISSTVPSGGEAVAYYSVGCGDPAKKPKLTVTYVGPPHYDKPMWFTALPKSTNQVYLGWRMDAQHPTIGYNVYRGSASGGPYSLVNVSPITASTNYVDTTGAGTFYYIVRAVAEAETLAKSPTKPM